MEVVGNRDVNAYHKTRGLKFFLDPWKSVPQIPRIESR